MSTYTYEKALDICEKMAEGSTFKKACRDSGVVVRTAYDWLAQNPEFVQMHQVAKQAAADHYVDECFGIIDVQSLDKEEVQHARLRVDFRKWYASKIYPKQYGDKLQVGGAEDLPGITIQDERLNDFTSRLSRLAESSKADDPTGGSSS